MKYTAIDIETYENVDLIPLLPAVEPDSRLKDEAKIQADIEKKRQEQISKMALNPLWGKIACIGYYNDDFQFCDVDDEKTMLKHFFDYSEQLAKSSEDEKQWFEGMKKEAENWLGQ